MIVGTAGHVDHGKTSLVRALTGVDTDRLKEEKDRGISIELGYAYLPLGDGGTIGFVDVPGHERFVHTMAAGACGIDFALLVIAADDGVMPQTREHLAILEFLGVKRGCVVISKIDRVDADRLLVVEAQVRAFLASTALSNASVVLVDATDAEHSGVQYLRALLEREARERTEHAVSKLFRLAIDRVFTLPGHGVFVAGTVVAGRVVQGDELLVMPAATRVRVRSIHAQNRAAAEGVAGQRCAFNVSGIELDGVRRGDWLVDPRLAITTTRLDADVRLLIEAEAITTWTPVHVHIGARHDMAHVIPLLEQTLPPGASGRVQLVLDRDTCALPGDRFILRDARAQRTLGGGVVLDPNAPARKRRTRSRMDYLTACEALIQQGDCEPLIACSAHGIAIEDLLRLTGRVIERADRSGAIVSLDIGGGWLIAAAQWNALHERTLATLAACHAQEPDEAGVDVGRLRRMVSPQAPLPVWRCSVDALLAAGRIARTGPFLHLPQHRPRLSAEDQALASRLQPLIAAGRFEPPWVRTLASQLNEDEQRVREVLRKQARLGQLCEVVRDLFYDREHVSSLASVAATLAREEGAVSAARYRDALGLGRKRSIQILEYFDRVGYTRRVRDAHVVRADSGW